MSYGEANTRTWTGSILRVAVLRVHVHDVRAAACPAAVQTTCDTTVVLDEVVWAEP